jgi:maleate isomerase
VYNAQFFRESGYEVVTLRRLDCPTTLAIATVDEATIRTALRELCEARVEAIVQVGTDLVMTRLADEAERWPGLPVIAVNAAMLWQALRISGMPDQSRGFGSLLREY